MKMQGESIAKLLSLEKQVVKKKATHKPPLKKPKR